MTGNTLKFSSNLSIKIDEIQGLEVTLKPSGKWARVWSPKGSVLAPSYGSAVAGFWLQKFTKFSLALALKEPEQTTPKLGEFWLSPLSLHHSANTP